MTCHDMTDLLVAYSGGELAPAQREFVEMHLERCAACQGTLRDLELTRRDLENLRGDSYQPQLSPVIMTTIRRRRLVTNLFRLLQIGVAVAVLLAAVRIAIPFLQPAPAGPPPGTSTHLVVAGNLIRVDAGTFTHQVVARRTQQVVSGGGSLFAFSNRQLLAINPSGGQPRRLAVTGDQMLLGVSPDGRTIWFGRQVTTSEFTIDSSDVRIGRYRWSDARLAGRIYRAAVSRDGSRLYVTATVGQAVYLKVVDLERTQLERAYLLGAFPPDSTPILSLDGKQVFVVGAGRLAVITLGEPEVQRLISDAGLTNQAVLAPGGTAVMVAHSDGGLLEVNPESGTITRANSGLTYSSLAWSDDNRWLFAAGGRRLDIFAVGQYLRPARRIEIGE